MTNKICKRRVGRPKMEDDWERKSYCYGYRYSKDVKGIFDIMVSETGMSKTEIITEALRTYFELFHKKRFG